MERSSASSVRNLLFILVIFLAGGMDSQRIYRGRCPRPSIQQDFDLERYLGKWFEYSKFNNYFQRNLKCVTAEYGIAESGVITVNNSGFDTNDGEMVTALATAVIPDGFRPAELKVIYSPFDLSKDPNYIVVETDYDNYAVVFSCYRFVLFPFIHLEYVWILTREQAVPPSNLTEIMMKLRRFRINPILLKISDQAGCSL